jgi:hypothetical protein
MANILVEVYNHTGTKTAVQPLVTDVAWLDELRGAGSGSFSVPLDRLDPSVRVGSRIKFIVDGVLRGGMHVSAIDVTAVGAGEDADRVATVSGPGLLNVLREAVVYPAGGFSSGAGDERTLDGTPGSILKTLIDEAKARGALADIAYDFTPTAQSGGGSWPRSVQITVPVGQNLADAVRQLADLGVVEVWADGSLIRARRRRGADLSSTVVLWPGHDVADAQHSSAGPLSTAVLYRWGAGLGQATETAAALAYGRSESFADWRDLRNVDARDDAVERFWEAFSAPGDASTIETVGTSWPAWAVGDTITVPTSTDVRVPRRVEALSVQVGESGELRFVPTLGEPRKALERRLAESLGGFSASRPAHRAATLVVAASDSSAQGKAAADLICDGVGDQAEINAAITAVASLPQDGRVLLLEGTYLIDNSVTMLGGVTLEGQGPSSVIQSTLPWNGPPLSAAMNGSQSGVTVKNLRFSLPDADGSGPRYSIIFNGDNCAVDGVHFVQTGGYDCVRFINASGLSAFVSGCRVVNCHFNQSGTGFVTPLTSHCVYIGGTGVVAYNVIAAGRVYGIHVWGHAEIVGNVVNGCTIGIYARSSTNAWYGGLLGASSVVANQVFGSRGVGIEFAGGVCSSNAVVGCNTSAGTNDAILLEGGRRSFVTGNTIMKGGTSGGTVRHGIRINSGTTDAHVIGNVIEPTAHSGTAISDAGTSSVIRTIDGPWPATQITFTPAGDVAATNVQTAIAELDAEKLAIAGGTLTGNLVLADGVDIEIDSTAGSAIGDAASRIGFFGSTPVAQQGPVDDPSGGTTVDPEARAAIVEIRDALVSLGLLMPPGS